MGDALPQLGLVGVLILLNAVFAGTEMALVSLRDSQVSRMEQQGGRGRAVAELVRDPNRFLATIQIGITLAGFLASAAAAVSLAEPLVEPLGFLGGAAEAVAIGLVTLVLTFLTLVFGELAPKRIAMQRAERWALFAARPLSMLARATRPAVWLLSKTSDVVVRISGADPSAGGDELTEEEVRDIVATQASFSDEQRTIISGALEIGDRLLRDVLVPRPRVVWIPADMPAPDALRALVASGHSRAPVARGELDDVLGIASLRELVGATGAVADHIRPAIVHPETKRVVESLRELQAARAQLAVVADEYGGVAGIITVEDLVEEIVGEIWDESDRDVVAVERHVDGSMVVPGRFPAHDLVDLGIDVDTGDSTTIAGVVLERLGRIPEHPGDVVDLGGWTAEVLAVERRAITSVRVAPR
jgi:putative hemolysin